ncbi:MAG TPA: hypothetical protein VK797_18030 [Tepidisphaeraceae bacterium]|jgi:hypothetical protein|nr:hypothetical protein [Tepidisphaeraceae bacterium]
MPDVTPSDVTPSVSDLSAVPASDATAPPAVLGPTTETAECPPAPPVESAPESASGQPAPQADATSAEQALGDHPQVPSATASQLAPQTALSISPPLAVDDLCAELKPDQIKAMRHIISGLTIPEAAVAAGVPRRTLYRWCNEDPRFAAALNLWKHEQLDSAQTQALGAVAPALRTIIAAIENGNLPASIQLVRALGVLAPVQPGETDPNRIRRKRRLAGYRKEKKLAEAEYKHEVNHLYRVDSVLAWDERLGEELAERDCFTERDENLWRRYELTLHLTEEECHEIRERKPAGPPRCLRPSAAEALAANERFSARAGWNVADHANSFLDRGRLAAQAAKGREEALKVFEILRARNPRREEAPVE